MGTEPPTLDPNLATDSVSHRILTNTQAGLTRFDTKTLRAVPCIAEKWWYSDDGRTVTFKIRDDALWSDGKPITSFDFLYSWKRLLDPKTGAEYSYFLYDIEDAMEFNSGKKDYFSGVTTSDEKTLIVRLKRPIVYLPMLVTFMVTYPVRQDIIEKYQNEWTEPKHYVSSGPFILKEWIHDYKVVLEPNPVWFGTKPKLKRVEFYVVGEPSTSLNLYRFGFFHTVGLFSLAIQKYKGTEEFIQTPGLRGFYVAFNIKKKPFDNVHLRRALAHSVDRTSIVKALGNVDIPATSWIPPGMLAHNPNIGLEFDPEKAKSELQKVKLDKQQKLKLYFNQSPENTKISEVLKESWRKILNLDVEIESMEWKMFLSTLNSDPPPLFRLGWGADFPDPSNFMDLFTSSSGNNYTAFASEEYDEIIEKASEERNEQKRIELYNMAQKILLEKEVAIIPLFWSTTNALKKKNLVLELNPLDIIYLDETYFK